MPDLQQTVLESWDRNHNIVMNLADRVTPELMGAKSGEAEWTIGEHLCHMHSTRRYWLREVAPEQLEKSNRLHTQISEDDWKASEDLDEIKAELRKSAASVREVTETFIDQPGPIGPYSHVLFFMQHMLWHDGWHVSSIMQALRAARQEPDEQWEEDSIWAVWRS